MGAGGQLRERNVCNACAFKIPNTGVWFDFQLAGTLTIPRSSLWRPAPGNAELSCHRKNSTPIDTEQTLNLCSLPKEILSDNFLWTQSTTDCVRLSATCQQFYAIMDSSFWQTLLMETTGSRAVLRDPCRMLAQLAKKTCVDCNVMRVRSLPVYAVTGTRLCGDCKRKYWWIMATKAKEQYNLTEEDLAKLRCEKSHNRRNFDRPIRRNLLEDVINASHAKRAAAKAAASKRSHLSEIKRRAAGTRSSPRLQLQPQS